MHEHSFNILPVPMVEREVDWMSTRDERISPACFALSLKRTAWNEKMLAALHLVTLVNSWGSGLDHFGTKEDPNATCAYWDESAAQWSSEGVQTLSSKVQIAGEWTSLGPVGSSGHFEFFLKWTGA